MTRNTKRIRDPKAPKRNLSAYLLYQNAMRDSFKNLNPGMTFGQLAKYTSAMYGEIPLSEKQVWIERAEEDKARYLEELQNYTPPPGYDTKGDSIMVTTNEPYNAIPPYPSQLNMLQQLQLQQQQERALLKAKAKKDIRDPNAPKRNIPAYILYQNAMRQQFQKENPGMTFGQLAKFTSHMYKNLTPEEKATWERRAQDDKIRYENELANYTPPPGHNARGIKIIEMDPNSSNYRRVVGKGRRGRRKTKGKDPDAPKRACGAYVYFTNEMRDVVIKDFPGIKFIEMGRVLGERWRNLSVEEKKRFEEMANEDKLRYQQELKEYTSKKKNIAIQQVQEQQQPAHLLYQHRLLSQQQQQILLSQQHQLQQHRLLSQQQAQLVNSVLQPPNHISSVVSTGTTTVPPSGTTSAVNSHGHYTMDPHQYQQRFSDFYAQPLS